MLELAAVVELGLAGLEYELAAWDELEAVEIEIAFEVAVDVAEIAVAAGSAVAV